MVGTLDFQVKTLVFETWLGQCVVFLGKALYSHCAPLSPPPGVWSIENTGWMGWEGEGVITCHHELASHRTQNRTEPQDSGSSGRYMPQKPG